MRDFGLFGWWRLKRKKNKKDERREEL